jgi:hypothetical protein
LRINYGRKKFYGTGPRGVNSVKLFFFATNPQEK